jgi:anti-anti-sigma factor
VINVTFEKNLVIISFDVDHVDSSNFREFKSVVQSYIKEGSKFIFDLGALKFIDSSGLGSFLSILRDLHKVNGDMVMCNPSAGVRMLFDLVCLDKVIQVFPDRKQAEQAFG